MSYSNGDGGLPFPQSRTGSISYNPTSTTSSASGGLNYFSSGNQQQRGPTHDSNHIFPMPQHVQWSNLASTSNNAGQGSTQQHAPAPPPPVASSSAANSIIVESPTESRSDTEEPVGNSSTNANNVPAGSSSGKRKTADGSPSDGNPRSKKKRNRAVLSCVPCKSRKVSCDIYWKIRSTRV